MVFDGPQFTENMYVLEEGEYPNPEALGLLNLNCRISSVHTVGHVSTDRDDDIKYSHNLTGHTFNNFA